ncbi:MAG TPA: TonB-dependent receptor [Gemmatimonadota bacterium]|nr:TonB-dependent receptor [Gemmatimonadota bacterium]
MRDVRPARGASIVLLLLVVSSIVPAAVRAQQAAATTGIVRGVVLDFEGNPVAGARVEVENNQTNLDRVVTTNSQGVFAATNLPVGTYDIEVTSSEIIGEITRDDVPVRLGETVQFELRFQPVEAEAILAISKTDLVDPTDVTASQRFDDEVLESLPNNGRNFLRFTLLTPGVGIVQGPDGDEITFSGQRGIFNNVIVDGADFNNPFFGEQRGGQRPAFTFNLDAVEEIVVVNQGATAEFGRSSSGFVNVLTKSGTNEFDGSVHYFGQYDGLSADFPSDRCIVPAGAPSEVCNPEFRQNQFGFTAGGPLKRDKAFFFVAYDQQEFKSTKQIVRGFPDEAEFQRLQAFLETAFGGALAGDFGPIERTDDNKAFIGKLDFILSDRHNASFKYNYTDTEQQNGTFDVDFWGRSANGLEKDHSHAVNGSFHSQFTDALSNELRFQWAREDRPRPYEGPTFPGSDRPFPDTAMSFANNVRFGLPFFLPIEAYDWRFQILDNVSILRGNHLFKFGAEYNYTEANQTFIGFANGRFIFSSVDGFINYVQQGPTYVECFDAAGAFVSANAAGSCPDGTSIGGPLLLYLQQAPVPPVPTVEDAGTQSIPQHEIAFFGQDTWNPTPNWTVNYGVRYEAQIQPDPITPAGEVFFAPLIGATRRGVEFPSDGEIPTDWNNIQPRFGVTYDIHGDGSEIFRGNSGLYYARTPGLIFASTRSTNGSIGQTIFRASFFNDFGLPPPAFDELIDTSGSFPDHPQVFVTAEDFENPRTWASSIEYERLLWPTLAGFVTYTYARTDDLFRFVDRNDAVFGSPFSTGLPAAGTSTGPADTLNGIGQLVTLESTAKSRYHGLTLGTRGSIGPYLELEANYTLSQDKSDDDNERDPFSFRYVDPSRLDREFGFSDRDQRHRFNAYVLARLPWRLYVNNTISAASAQPTSEVCGSNNQGTGERAITVFGPTSDRICPDGSILERNTIRRDNEFFSWDLRVTRPFTVPNGSSLELIGEVFNLFNTDNFLDASPTALLFNFDGTIRSGLGDPRRFQLGARLKY